MSTIHDVNGVGGVARKYRRALRNETGARFTLEELRVLADLGLLAMLQQAEADDLRSRWQATVDTTDTSARQTGPARTKVGSLPADRPRISPAAMLALVGAI